MIDKIIKEAEQALEVYCKAYDEKWSYHMLFDYRLRYGLCYYLRYKGSLYDVLSTTWDKKYMRYPAIDRDNNYYKALLPRIVYLQTLIKELRK